MQPLTKMVLIRRCAALRPGPVTDTTSAAKHTVRAIARRWLALDTEIKTHEKVLTKLTGELVPDLVAAFGIGPDVAAEMLIVAGDNPERVKSEPAFARLCGVAPIPASSGMTTRHRLNRGGHRQANSALYRAVIVRLQHHQPTQAYYQLAVSGKRPPSVQLLQGDGAGGLVGELHGRALLALGDLLAAADITPSVGVAESSPRCDILGFARPEPDEGRYQWKTLLKRWCWIYWIGSARDRGPTLRSWMPGEPPAHDCRCGRKRTLVAT